MGIPPTPENVLTGAFQPPASPAQKTLVPPSHGYCDEPISLPPLPEPDDDGVSLPGHVLPVHDPRFNF